MVISWIKDTLKRDRALALLVLAAMAIHTWLKYRWGTVPELLWGCNVASFVIILGLWFQAPRLIGAGFLWHLCIGEPGYLYGVAQTGHTHWVSVLVHSLPTLAAFFSLRRTGLPKSSPYLAFLMFLALVPISHFLTPPSLNINMTHQRLWLLQQHFPGNWDYRLVFSSIMLAVLVMGDWIFARILHRSPRTV